MTGFGAGGASLDGGRITVEARSVNHRYLDVRVRVPTELSDLGFHVEQLVRSRHDRGRFDVAVQIALSAPLGGLNIERAQSAYAALSRLRDEVAPGTPLPLTALSLVPDLFSQASALNRTEAEHALELATRAALDALDSMRADEGAALAKELNGRLGAIDELRDSISTRAASSPTHHATKLRARIATLLEGTGVAADPARLETEIALLADRLDVTEEIVRLASHTEQFHALLGAEEPVGRRLDFLLQEMGRETNTIGAKCQDAELSHQVVQLKAELSRMREQVQNVE